MCKSKIGLKEEAVCEENIARILHLHGVLEALPDLHPSKHVDACFTELVDLAISENRTNVVTQVLHDPRVRTILPSLHRICSKAECLLEAYWADRLSVNIGLINSKGFFQRLFSRSCPSWKCLHDFPYFDNYELLTRMEVNAVSTVCPKYRKVAFIGSGPLPLTSICLLRQLQRGWYSNVEIMNIDCDLNAISQSQILCRCLGRQAQAMRFHHTRFPGDLNLGRYDIIYLAALAGLTQTAKEDLVLSTLDRMSGGAVLVIRSIHGMRALLYPEFDATTERLQGVLEVCLVVHPYGKVVNSVVICRKRMLSVRHGSRTIAEA